MSFYRIETGTYRVGELGITYRRRNASGRTDKALLILHGRTPAATNGAAQFQPAAGGGPPQIDYFTRFAGMGAMVIDAGAGGGLTTWGNDDSIAAVDAAISWVRGANGWADPSKKVVLLGYSMGNVVAMNYIVRNPQNVAGYIGQAPPYDLQWFHDVGGFGAEIDAAYGGSLAANGAGHDPKTFANQITTPTRLFHAVDDGTVPWTQGVSLYQALGSTDKWFYQLAGGGHGAFWGYLPLREMRDWLIGLNY